MSRADENEPRLPHRVWRNDMHYGWTVEVPDIFGTMSPVMIASGEPVTITNDEMVDAGSSFAAREKMQRIVQSCTRVSLPRRPPEAPKEQD